VIAAVSQPQSCREGEGYLKPIALGQSSVFGKCSTDLFSEIFKGRDPNVLRHAAAYRGTFGVLTVSALTVMEVVKGLHKMRREPAIGAVLAALAGEEVLAFDRIDAEQAGRIHADLERTGQPVGWADTMIAAIALRHGLELVTGNTAHFLRIRQLGYPLTLANWRE
jgi:predicted nucleic acid-binding protein